MALRAALCTARPPIRLPGEQNPRTAAVDSIPLCIESPGYAALRFSTWLPRRFAGTGVCLTFTVCFDQEKLPAQGEGEENKPMKKKNGQGLSPQQLFCQLVIKSDDLPGILFTRKPYWRSGCKSEEAVDCGF
ncbi:hypothetical protein DFH09DRAFT_1091706 [Mycena vulgaris]|nr:hypothetical protein DFH09DRAFT_1091706 [Mycena vulgaris]